MFCVVLRWRANRLSQKLRPGCLAFFGAAACLLLATVLGAGQSPKIPTVNASVGGCAADFVVRDGEQKPLYSAGISLAFRYGFLNLHQVSLEAFTNSDGRARFEGLPDAPKKPLIFRVQYGDRQKSVPDYPATNCNASFTVVLP